MKLLLEFNICSNSKDKRKLRDYQEEAISKWCENNKKGIFKMATGTGKTFTALNCISSALNDDLNLITVIACPYAHLTEQWLNDVENIWVLNVIVFMHLLILIGKKILQI